MVGEGRMTTSGSGTGTYSAPLNLMSCVRESSPQELLPNNEADHDRNNGKFKDSVLARRLFETLLQ